MTEAYDWNPMPHKVDVRCPSCGNCAVFEFAEVVQIALKKDVVFFQESPIFDYQEFQDSNGHKWHGAVYYAGHHGGDINAIGDLPNGYTPDDWAHSMYLYRGNGQDIGSITCRLCHLRRKHELRWPKDAFYSIDYKTQQLWAFHRESAIQLRDYIASPHRILTDFKWKSFLRHVPSVFKQKKAREQVVKKLDALLNIE